MLSRFGEHDRALDKTSEKATEPAARHFHVLSGCQSFRSSENSPKPRVFQKQRKRIEENALYYITTIICLVISYINCLLLLYNLAK
jgi:hypothetical protein